MKPVVLMTISALAGLLIAMPKTNITPKLVWNASPSIPVGLYVIKPTEPRRGDLALARLPPPLAELAQRRGYLTATDRVLKPVVAVAGDRVCRVGDHILLHGQRAATAIRRDAKGRLMPVWHGCRRLVGGELFLLSDDALSFDGRYFGSVAADHVGGRAVPLWLRRATP